MCSMFTPEVNSHLYCSCSRSCSCTCSCLGQGREGGQGGGRRGGGVLGRDDGDRPVLDADTEPGGGGGGGGDHLAGGVGVHGEELLSEQGVDLAPVEGFYTKGVTEGIVPDQGELDVTWVKQGVLLGQDVLGKIKSYLGEGSIRNMNLGAVLMFHPPPRK